MDPAIVVILSALTSTLGAVGGLGGAVLLVPVLVLLGWSPIEAAPVGMAMVAAGTLSATITHRRDALTNHRLGVTLETAASVGVAAGAAISVLVAPRTVTLVLGIAAIVSALIGGTRTTQRNLPVDGASMFALHDRPGTLDSAYADERDRVIPYRPRRLRIALGLMGGAGVVAGMTGSSAGYLKTPIMSEVMHVPTKVAAATSVFMVGITASVALAVYAYQGRLSAAIAPAVLGGLIGGRTGSALQPRLPANAVRMVLSVALIAIGLLLVVGP